MRQPFNCGKFKLAIASFELELIDGSDEAAAVARVGESGSGAELQEQLIAQSIVAVDGEEVIRPFVKWSGWDSRTRSFVRAGFRALAIPTKKELDAFLVTEVDGVFDSAGLDLAFGTIGFRTLEGRQELATISALGEAATGFDITEALISSSISEIDAQAVDAVEGQPHIWTRWDIRTRAFVRAAHERVTAGSEAEIAEFLEDSLRPPVGAGPTAPGSSESGPGSPGT